MRRTERHEVELRARRIVSCLAARAPVRHPVVVALPPRPDARAAARARPADAPVDLMAARAGPVDRRAHQPGRRLERAPAVGLGHVAEPPPGRELARPTATRRATCSRSRRRATGRAASRRTSGSGRPGACARASRRCAAAARGCPARAGRARACAARAPGRSRARPRPARRAGRATACRRGALRAGRPSTGRTCAGASAGRRRPRSAGAGSCRAPSTDSSTRPSIRSATRSACARGCGESAAIRWPTSTCRRRAARWIVSPSGTAPR